MTLTPSRLAAPARHLLCLDLLSSELAVEDPRHPARFQGPVENSRRLLHYARAAGWQVTHVHHRASLDTSARPVQGLEPLPSERVLYRTGLSAFSNRTFRRTVQSQRAELVILGFSLSASCLATALIAHDWNLPVTLVDDVFQPSSADRSQIDALRAIARSLTAPFVRMAGTESLTGSRRHLRLVSAA
jgi:nicotinamidase-related amidase